MSSTTIQRCPHDPEHPYFMLSRALVRDNSISPNCRLMLIHLLSNKDGWEIKVKQIINIFSQWDGWGRDSVYKYIKEAMNAGYIRVEEYLKKGLKRIKYFLSEGALFKESLPHTATQDTATQYAKERSSKRQEEISPKDGNSKLTTKEAPPLPTSDPIGITVFRLDEGIFPDGSKLSLRTARAFAKYDDRARERLEANVRYFNAQIAIGMRPKKSYECWLQDCINTDYASKESNNTQNDLYAKFIKGMHNLSNQELYIMKTVVNLNGDSIDKKLPPLTFNQILDNYVKNRR